MFLMVPWGLPVLVSLSPSSQNTDAAGVTGDLQLHIVLRFCGLWIVDIDLTFFSQVSWSSCSDHVFLLLFAAKDATRAGPVRTAWKMVVIPEPVGNPQSFQKKRMYSQWLS